jgi:hypothetical protein
VRQTAGCRPTAAAPRPAARVGSGGRRIGRPGFGAVAPELDAAGARRREQPCAAVPARRPAAAHRRTLSRQLARHGGTRAARQRRLRAAHGSLVLAQRAHRAGDDASANVRRQKERASSVQDGGQLCCFDGLRSTRARPTGPADAIRHKS